MKRLHHFSITGSEFKQRIAFNANRPRANNSEVYLLSTCLLIYLFTYLLCICIQKLVPACIQGKINRGPIVGVIGILLR